MIDFFTIALLPIQGDFLYKAVCINGFGHGIGRSISSTLEMTKINIATLVDISDELNLPLNLISKEEFLSRKEESEKFFESFNIKQEDLKDITWYTVSLEEIKKY